MNARWETIRGIEEETGCDICGMPLTHGDPVLVIYLRSVDKYIEDPYPVGMYCGHGCARSAGHEGSIPRMPAWARAIED